MATRQDLVEGVRFLAREATRAASFFDEEQWQRPTVDGWTVREVYCHLLATAQGMALFIPALRSLPADADLDAMLNVDEINARGVAANAEKTPAELVAGIEQAYAGLAPVIEELEPEFLAKPVRFGHYTMPVADLAATAIVLHGLAHTYHCIAAGTPHI